MQQKLMDACVRHVLNYKASGAHMKPKHHQFIHLTKNMMKTGNPSYHTTYEDESINGFLATIGRSAHPTAFAMTLFEKLLAMEDGRV